MHWPWHGQLPASSSSARRSSRALVGTSRSHDPVPPAAAAGGRGWVGARPPKARRPHGACRRRRCRSGSCPATLARADVNPKARRVSRVRGLFIEKPTTEGSHPCVVGFNRSITLRRLDRRNSGAEVAWLRRCQRHHLRPPRRDRPGARSPTPSLSTGPSTTRFASRPLQRFIEARVPHRLVTPPSERNCERTDLPCQSSPFVHRPEDR